MSDSRLDRVRWCECGQPWLPAGGLYGTTEETECPACILRRMIRRRETQARAIAAHIAWLLGQVHHERITIIKRAMDLGPGDDVL